MANDLDLASEDGWLNYGSSSSLFTTLLFHSERISRTKKKYLNTPKILPTHSKTTQYLICPPMSSHPFPGLDHI